MRVAMHHGIDCSARRTALAHGLTAVYPRLVSTGPRTASAGASFLADLRVALPGLRLLTDATDTEAYRWDETEYMHPGMPLGVAFPTSTADVSTIMRLATRAPGAGRAARRRVRVCRVAPSRSRAR